MVKTTVYLPEALKEKVGLVAAREGRSEADVVRAALEEYTSARAHPRPTLPLFEGRELPSDVAMRVDEYLDEGFGRD